MKTKQSKDLSRFLSSSILSFQTVNPNMSQYISQDIIRKSNMIQFLAENEYVLFCCQNNISCVLLLLVVDNIDVYSEPFSVQ